MSEQVRLTVGGVGDAEAFAALEDLTTWLYGEGDLRGLVRPARPAPGPGEMGSLTDALIIAVGARGALTALAGSLRAWFAQPRRSKVTLRIPTGPDTFLEIDADRVKSPDLERMLEMGLHASSGAPAAQGRVREGVEDPPRRDRCGRRRSHRRSRSLPRPEPDPSSPASRHRWAPSAG
jgi:hypothetical protein